MKNNDELVDGDLLIRTEVNLPIRIMVDNKIEEVGSFYANIDNDLNSISIQIYIQPDSKQIVKDNMDLVKEKYDKFYQSFIAKANLVGWSFIK